MATGGMSPDARKEALRGSLTEEDLRLGREASKVMDAFCIVALVACVGIAVFAFMNVPSDTRMPYDGKYNRSGTGIPMQIAMIPCPLVLIGLRRSGRKPDAHQMTKSGRTGLYVLGTAMISACVIGQWVMASGILEAGGYL